MTDEQQFEKTVQQRIAKAEELTGHSFWKLKKLIAHVGAVKTARRLIASVGKFHDGMKVLFHAGLLHLTIEQAVIEFGTAGRIFTPQEVHQASERLQMMRLLF